MSCLGLLYCVNLIVGLCTVPLAHVSLGCKISPMLARVGWSTVWVSSRKNIFQKKPEEQKFFIFIYFLFFEKYMCHLRFCKTIPLPSCGMMFVVPTAVEFSSF
jgi:hypothetical protein